MCAVDRLKNDGPIVATVDLGFRVGEPTGVAVDSKGKIWATNINSNSVSRIDPTLGELVGSTYVGAVDLTIPLGDNAYPYNHGDMTGSTLLASTTGNWLVRIDTNNDTIFEWRSTSISWTASVPDTATTLTVTASSSNDGTMFTSPTSVVSGTLLNSGILVTSGTIFENSSLAIT